MEQRPGQQQQQQFTKKLEKKRREVWLCIENLESQDKNRQVINQNPRKKTNHY